MPKKKYQSIDIDNISDDSHFVRRSLLDKKNQFNDVGILRIDAIVKPNDLVEFFRLSFNLKSIFIEQDLKYRVSMIDKKFNADWEENENVLLGLFKYELFSDYNPIYFTKKSIHNKPFPKIIKSNKYTEPLVGMCSIVHKPTIYNFWHFQFKFTENDSFKEIKKNGSSWQKDSINEFVLLNFNCFKTHLDWNSEIKIDKKVYCKQ